MLATFTANKCYRGTQILVADKPEGPYIPLTNGPVTPPSWQCLDGTLYLDPYGAPWIVFCHEWKQIHNGSVCAMRLSLDLKKAISPPIILFNASEAPWVYPSGWPMKNGTPQLPEYLNGPKLKKEYPFPIYVTDGPFLHRNKDGTLLMLWSSLGMDGYTMGLARSSSSHITGPWEQLPDPLWSKDGGHGMIFRDFDGQLFIALHHPNNTPDERSVFIKIKEKENTICLQTPFKK